MQLTVFNMFEIPNLRMDVVLVVLSCYFGVLLHSSHTSAQDTTNQPQTLAYFNGTSQATVNTQLNLQTGITFSFRTCNGGEILSQTGDSGDSIDFQVDSVTGAFRVQWTVDGQPGTLALGGDYDTNVWRLTNIEFKLGQLELTIGDNSTILDSALLNIDLSGGDLFIGTNFDGCIEEIQGLNLASATDFVNVLWGECPLDEQVGCGAPIIDPCYSIPCQHGGICTNLGDSFTCDCTVRYNGSQCETDTGPLCQKPKYAKDCQNGGFCREDATGNYTFCQCPAEYEGELCEKPANYCAPMPCQNAGICHTNDANDGYTCECMPGWVGTNCEINIDDCTSSPCRNNGICVDGINEYTCDCTNTGFEGTHCDTNIDECTRDDPCQNGGTCADRSGGYFCICVPGYEGEDCDLETDECASQPCQNSGTCTDDFNGYNCNCVLGFRGTHCEENINDCVGIRCPDTYICQDLVNDFECVCPPGKAPEVPDGECLDMNECNSSPCVNGQCSNLDNRYECVCDPGWNGINCDQVDECASNPCQNGATCQDMDNGYQCLCVPGYAGDQCEIDINECDETPCLNGGTCTDLLNGFNCECVQGFEGDRCEIDIDDCMGTPCQNGATCNDLVNDYTCVCTPEWMGQNCTEQYDACVDLDPCQNGATCTTTPPSRDYVCNCVPGFDGDNCENNIDECIGETCPPGQICYDLINDFMCACPVGYEGDNCATEIDECASSPCVFGECIDNIGNYTCNCTLGYDGINCDNDIDECEPVPCLNGAYCLQNMPPPGYQCFCVPGFTGNNCEYNVPECDSDPCLNGATCIDDVNKYRCECAPGFKGDTCEIDIDECASDPCQNSGTCQDMVNGYSCQCAAGFNGTDCEIEIDECESMPCLNGGHCMDLINGYVCNCTDTGFTGDSCQINIDDCEPMPCKNNATCSDLVKDYDCNCYLGYNGKDCEIDEQECASTPCQNDGMCLEMSNQTYYQDGFEHRDLFPDKFSYANASGYVCVCEAGFEGVECEINIDECESGPCANGATCEDLVNGYRCFCASGWEGPNCIIEINECDSTPCANEGTCTDIIDGYTCSCTSEYGGLNCDILLTACIDNTQCLNGATCIPFYDTEFDTHNFTCSCGDGYIGDFCQVSTSASFEDGTHMIDSSTNNMRTISYSLSFATTLPSGLLLYSGDGADYILLEMFEGQLYFTYSDVDQNTLEMAPLGSMLADGEWHTVELDITETDITLSVTGVSDTNDLSSSCSDGKCTSTMPKDVNEVILDQLLIGGLDASRSSKMSLTRSKLHYTGCMQDILNGGTPVLPPALSGSGLGSVAVGDVVGGCARTEQCSPDPCSGSGECTDLWWTYECSCVLGWAGPNCNYSFVSGTFSFEETTSYAVFFANAPLTLEENIIRFIFRTRESDGLIFHTKDGNSYITLELVSGKLFARADFTSGMQEIEVEENFADARYHRVTLQRKTGELSLQVNNMNAKVMAFADNTLPNFDDFYVGGLSDFNSIPPPGAVTSGVAFKGCLSDVKYNNYSLEFFPLDIPGFVIDNFPISTNENVLEDCQSDDACRTNPCENGGTCEVTWNDFICDCPNGFGGKNCSELTICSFNPCPNQVDCLDRNDGGYDCVTDATFDGVDSLILYHNSINASRDLDTISLRLRTRENEGIILHSHNEQLGFFFTLEVFQGMPRFRFDLGREYDLQVDRSINDGKWHDLEVIVGSEETIGIVDKIYNVTITTPSQAPLESTITQTGSSDVYLANTDFSSDKYFTNYNGFDGCLDEVRISEFLLPFFNETTFNSTSEENFYATINAVSISCMGDPVCDTIPCENGATCNDLWNDYDCECLPGFNGSLCEINIDECASNPCLMGSTCKDEINNFTCRCMPGYEGRLCDIDIDECASNPCMNNATGCIDLVDGFECNCTANFTGRRCEFPVSMTCDDLPCKNGATCLSLNDTLPGENAYRCECVPGYEGENCAYEIDYCANHTCLNGATCNSSLDLLDYVCHCIPGYDGRYCENNINECEGVICQNGGTCADGINEYQCNCVPGFEGDHCETEINECVSNPCENSAPCEDIVNGFICHCQYGYEGVLCQLDKDECLSNPCQNDATCKNTLGDFICDCPIDTYGKLCDVTPCTPSPCLNRASCEAFPPGDFACNCTLGYQGPTCLVASCSGVECQNSAICFEDAGKTSWKCLCPQFFEGEFCQWPGPCVFEPCENGGTCEQSLIGDGEFNHSCICPIGFNGTYCENEIDWCASNPCQQQGSNCTSDNLGFNCTCAPGYSGTVCEIKLPDCASGLCLNGATCIDYDYSYECVCVPGFQGTQCEVNFNECASEPCQNDGVCVDLVDRYTCDCAGTGYEGANCETDINECLSQPCQNGGTCENSEGSFKCECVEGYIGDFCQAEDPCIEKPCENDGKCEPSFFNGTAVPKCTCKGGFEGVKCEQRTGGEQPVNWLIIGIIIGIVVILILIIVIIAFIIVVKNKRATQGTYSPSRQEITGSRVEMDNVLKLPPEERLI